jgi:hypothetical protein
MVWATVITAVGQEAARPITPTEAFKRVDQKVVVGVEVKSTGGNTARYWNSEMDFRDNNNFAIFIPNIALAGFKQAEIEDPGMYYKGKMNMVTGTVALAQGRPQIRVENANQIKVVGNNTAPLRPSDRLVQSSASLESTWKAGYFLQILCRYKVRHGMANLLAGNESEPLWQQPVIAEASRRTDAKSDFP